jgi:polyisoprenoid-binding protein YceI
MDYATVCTFLAISGLASASPVTYTIDPNHTHPEFETDHLGRATRASRIALGCTMNVSMRM